MCRILMCQSAARTASEEVPEWLNWGHNPWSAWWAWQDLNLQPTDYESAALTELSYRPRG